MPRRKMTYVICYDIANQKRRNELAKCLDGFGDRVQYSVFEAVLDRPLFDKLFDSVIEIIDVDEDRVGMYPLCADCAERAAYLGLAKLEERPGRETTFIV